MAGSRTTGGAPSWLACPYRIAADRVWAVSGDYGVSEEDKAEAGEWLSMLLLADTVKRPPLVATHGVVRPFAAARRA